MINILEASIFSAKKFEKQSLEGASKDNYTIIPLKTDGQSNPKLTKLIIA